MQENYEEVENLNSNDYAFAIFNHPLTIELKGENNEVFEIVLKSLNDFD